MSEEIKTLLQTYQRALNAADLDLVRSVYAKDAVVIGQPFPTATGIEAILALYADFLSKLDFNVQFISKLDSRPPDGSLCLAAWLPLSVSYTKLMYVGMMLLL